MCDLEEKVVFSVENLSNALILNGKTLILHTEATLIIQQL